MKVLEMAPPPIWESQVHLRKCRLLRFDSDGQCLDNGLQIRLDQELGLYVDKEGKEDDS
jgi:hypothetical protein